MEPYVKLGSDCNNSILIRGDHVAYAEVDISAARAPSASLLQGRVVGFRGTSVEIEPTLREGTVVTRMRYDVIKVNA
jgi:hypothetical protein